ncbi:hypothetical protein [Actinopolymorpha pittospori]|uniref:Uncharacterized protein n=1 Tax=Actinopolymorpha pittospori TaxID=648752 RepID=A0A927RB14_9ACTN|nr:hypothetical protein [Actinopolymorpha pittospori]MBE1605625.1 hypothetical protein [Actinopolymorpha pittospori]
MPAARWLATVEAEIIQGRWTDPLRGKVLFADFGDRWITERSGLRPRTRDLYRWLFGKYLTPSLGRKRLDDLDAAVAMAAWADLVGCVNDRYGEDVSAFARHDEHLKPRQR